MSDETPNTNEGVQHVEHPICAAYEAASAVVHFMHEPDDEEENVVEAGFWPTIGLALEQDEADLYPPALRIVETHLAPFVRENRTAPTEALYRHARAKKVHLEEPAAFQLIPVAYRLAYQVFRDTLLSIDAAVEAERRIRASQMPTMPRARFTDASDTILERHGSELVKQQLPKRSAQAPAPAGTKPAPEKEPDPPEDDVAPPEPQPTPDETTVEDAGEADPKSPDDKAKPAKKPTKK
jgi:hypothetical protein